MNIIIEPVYKTSEFKRKHKEKSYQNNKKIKNKSFQTILNEERGKLK